MHGAFWVALQPKQLRPNLSELYSDLMNSSTANLHQPHAAALCCYPSFYEHVHLVHSFPAITVAPVARLLFIHNQTSRLSILDKSRHIHASRNFCSLP